MSEWIDAIECLKGGATSSSSWGPVVCKFSMWELKILLFQILLDQGSKEDREGSIGDISFTISLAQVVL